MQPKPYSDSNNFTVGGPQDPTPQSQTSSKDSVTSLNTSTWAARIEILDELVALLEHASGRLALLAAASLFR